MFQADFPFLFPLVGINFHISNETVYIAIAITVGFLAA